MGMLLVAEEGRRGDVLGRPGARSHLWPPASLRSFWHSSRHVLDARYGCPLATATNADSRSEYRAEAAARRSGSECQHAMGARPTCRSSSPASRSPSRGFEPGRGRVGVMVGRRAIDAGFVGIGPGLARPVGKDDAVMLLGEAPGCGRRRSAQRFRPSSIGWGQNGLLTRTDATCSARRPDRALAAGDGSMASSIW